MDTRALPQRLRWGRNDERVCNRPMIGRPSPWLLTCRAELGDPCCMWSAKELRTLPLIAGQTISNPGDPHSNSHNILRNATLAGAGNAMKFDKGARCGLQRCPDSLTHPCCRQPLWSPRSANRKVAWSCAPPLPRPYSRTPISAHACAKAWPWG